MIAFIPARGGSKGVPRKNIRDLCGKPLIAHSIELAKKLPVSRVIVNTDDDEIQDVAEEYGAEVQRRPDRLGKDNTSMVELLRSEVKKLDPTPDAVVLLQPTTPFRNLNQTAMAIGLFEGNKDRYDSLVSVERVPDKYNPHAMFIENNGKKVLFRELLTLKEKIVSRFTGKTYIGPLLSGYPVSQRITRRQNFPDAWLPTGSVYVFKTENLKQGNIYGKETILLEGESHQNINTEEDFTLLENLCEQK